MKTSSSKAGRNRKAVSPAISSVILTSVIVVLLLVTLVFANNYLNTRLAEYDFSAMKQFMQTIGLQVDDVAWTIGRTQTTRYASQFGTLNLETATLTYTVYVNGNLVFSKSTGILLFNMPISRYSISNSYRERITPSSNSHFLQMGTTAPVAHIFVMEKLPMNDGNYIRIVIAPSIRMLNSTITVNGIPTNYFKFYLPVLNLGVTPRYSQSVTLEGTNVLAASATSVNNIRIHLDFPKSGLGLDNSFFGFNSADEQIAVAPGSTMQFYTGIVTTSLGLYS